MNTSRTLALALVAATMASAPASAQETGPGWQAWYGCWAPSTATGQVDTKAPITCVDLIDTPNVVQISTIANGKVQTRDTIDASGVARNFTSKDCSGTQSASYSADRRRVYLTSSMLCGTQRSTSTSILALSPSGDWLDIRGVRSGEGQNVRVARYHPVDIRTLNDNVPANLLDRIASAQGARVAASAPVGVKAVIEANRIVAPEVTEAWIMERGQKFALDAKTLVSLADAGLPGGVTDAMVAVSNPGAFETARVAQTQDGVITQRPGAIVALDPWGSGYGYGYSPYDYYGLGYYYSPYRYGYGYGYGGGYYNPPIVIVSGGSAGGGGGTNPKVVKGRGYTQNGSGGSTGSTQTRAATSSTPSTSAPASSSSGSTSAPAAAQSSSGQRTAKERP